MNEEPEEIDTLSTTGAICPYCAHENEVDREDREQGEHETQCGKCERAFMLEIEYHVYFESERFEEYIERQIIARQATIAIHKKLIEKSSNGPSSEYHADIIKYGEGRITTYRERLEKEMKAL